MGKLHVIDDGTCVPNGYAKVSHDGIVTHSDEVTTMRVMRRISDDIILVLKKTANEFSENDIETEIADAITDALSKTDFVTSKDVSDYVDQAILGGAW